MESVIKWKTGTPKHPGRYLVQTKDEMIEKIKDDLSSTNDEFPDYLRFLRDNDGSWTIESFFDENVGCDEDGKPSIVDFMSNIDEMDKLNDEIMDRTIMALNTYIKDISHKT